MINNFDIAPIEFDYSVITQGAGAGIMEAVMVVAVLGFIVWAVVLALKDPS